MSKPRICVDFDNTIWDGEKPMPQCIEALTRMSRAFTIAIFSARLTEVERTQMKAALDEHKIPYDEILGQKPEAVAYIDDKGIRFEGWDKIEL